MINPHRRSHHVMLILLHTLCMFICIFKKYNGPLLCAKHCQEIKKRHGLYPQGFLI